MLINTIYMSSEGEGIWIGLPQIFVRFQGCNIGCVNCDSKETWEFSQNFQKNLEDVVAEIVMLSEKPMFPVKRISITGGDPLHQSHLPAVRALISELKIRNFTINIEASGTRVVDDIFEQVDQISFDLKTPSTGVKTSKELILKMHELYADKSQIKAVVDSREDFAYAYETFLAAREKFPKSILPWVITPCFEPEADFPRSKFQDILRLNESYGGPFRVIGQQHKWIYGAQEKNV